jgi:hypothetical protein
MRRPAFFLLTPLVLAACASFDTTSSSGPGKQAEVVVVEPSPEELRAAQLRKQGQEIEELREALEAERARSDAAAARMNAAAQQAQSEKIKELREALEANRAQSDAATARMNAATAQAQSEMIEELRAELEANRARSDAATARMNAATAQAQAEMRAMESELAQVRVRADSAAAQSDKAFAIATEFLSNLVAAREDQRAIVERNISVFDRLELRLGAIEGRIAETRNMSQAELAATRTRSSEMEQKMKDADQELLDLREQLLQLHRNTEETRAAIDSGPMLDLLRQLEGTQRDTSGLRGALEEMQQEQEVASKRMQNYYLDLDARIQDLQNRERAAREAEARLYEGVAAPKPPPDLSDDGVDVPAIKAKEADRHAGEKEIGIDVKASDDTVEPERPVTELPAAEPIEALPLLEEKSPASSFDAKLAEPEHEIPVSSGKATPDGSDVGGVVTEKSMRQTAPVLGDQDTIDPPAGDNTGAAQDALPDIVDTKDVIPGEPFMQDEIIPENGETDRNRMEKNELAPADQTLPIDRDRESSRKRLDQRHAVIITDWTADGDARPTPEKRSPK